MMKKFFTIFNLGLILIFNGCLNLEVETFIGGDGSGSSIIHYWTDFEILFNDTSSSNHFSFKEDVIRKNFSDENIEIKSIKIWKKEEDTTYHTEVKIVFDDINRLSNCTFFKDYEISFVDGAPGQKIFNQKLKGSNLSIADLNKYKIKFIYHFPGPIVTDNATERRNNDLSWSFSLEQLKTDKTLTATVKVPANSGIGYIVAVSIMILIGLWVILIIRKRKHKPEE